MRHIALWLILLGSLTSTVQAQDERTETSASLSKTEMPVRWSFDLADLKGQSAGLLQNDGRKVRAFVFLSTTCPVANSYTAALNRLAGNLPDNVRLFGVIADPFVTHREAVQHFQEYAVSFPILFDGSGLLAELLKPTHVPEAFVFDRDSRLVYRGAIDNAYESIGRRRTNVEHHYLRDAIQAAASGKSVTKSQTEPVGCVFPKKNTPA